MKNNPTIFNFLQAIAIIGNGLFLIWFLYMRINEGFRGTIFQTLSTIGLICLLILNACLLFAAKTKSKTSLLFLPFSKGE
jgi:hypothetical protein